MIALAYFLADSQLQYTTISLTLFFRCGIGDGIPHRYGRYLMLCQCEPFRAEGMLGVQIVRAVQKLLHPRMRSAERPIPQRSIGTRGPQNVMSKLKSLGLTACRGTEEIVSH